MKLFSTTKRYYREWRYLNTEDKATQVFLVTVTTCWIWKLPFFFWQHYKKLAVSDELRKIALGY